MPNGALLFLLMWFSSLPFEESLCPLDFLRKDYASCFVPRQKWVTVSRVPVDSARLLCHCKPASVPLLNLNGQVIEWRCTILIYTVCLWLSIVDGVTGLKELAFLRDLAEQNSGKYGVLDRTALPVIKGSMMVLNQLSNLETTVGRFYTNLPNRMIDEAVFSLPFSDEMGDGESGGNFLLKKGEKKWT